MTSWLVAPSWTCFAASADVAATCAVSCLTKGMASVPARPSRASCEASKRAVSQAREMACAWAALSRPWRAQARASAPSKPAIAASSLSSERSSAQTSSAKSSSRLRSRSVVEEDGFVLALQQDVPLQDLALRLGDQRRAALGRHQREDGILLVRFGFIRKVDARREMLEHAPHENRDDEVGRLQAAPGSGYAPGLDGPEAESALGVGRDASEASPALLERLLLRIFGVRVLAGGVRLPDLDQAVVHALAVAVHEAPLHGDALAFDAAPGDVARDEPVQPDVQVRAD